MTFCHFFSVTTLILLVSLLCLQKGHHVLGSKLFEQKEWERSLTLNLKEGIKLDWNICPSVHCNNDNGNGYEGRWLDMQVFAPTKGYVGLGFSHNGAMKGSDIIVVWVDQNGQAHLRDMHGEGNWKPTMDQEQNYKLVDAQETKEGTIFRFTRPLDTCDSDHDLEITEDTMRIIWALGHSDPVPQGKTSEIHFDYHGTNRRGVKSVLLLSKPVIAPFPDAEGQEQDGTVKHWDLMMANNQVSSETTTYFCQIVKFHDTSKKHHMIGYRPVISPPENVKFVHHMCMYECLVSEEMGGTASKFERYTSTEGERCYTPNMPPEWATHCVTFFMCWVAGSEGEMFPEHVGSPIGEQHNGTTYFMLEMHYNNPEKLTFSDSSGIRLFYTDKLREYDANIMLISYRITPFLLIPPHRKSFETYGICSGECTAATIPKEGIKAISVLLHAHLAGRKIRLRHIRNGTELPPIGDDSSYDFNYQQAKVLNKEVTILPGDELVTECDYGTLDRKRSVLGGLATTQEMCQVFLMYYPKIALSQCSSQAELHDFFSALGIDNVTSPVFKPMNLPYNPTLWSKEKQKFDPPDNAKELENQGDGKSFSDVYDLMEIQQPNNLRHLTVGQRLQQMDWRDDKLAGKVEKGWKNGRHYAYCTAHGRKRVPIKDFVVRYPKINKVYQRPRQCAAQLTSGSSSLASYYSIVSTVSIFLISLSLFQV